MQGSYLEEGRDYGNGFLFFVQHGFFWEFPIWILYLHHSYSSLFSFQPFPEHRNLADNIQRECTLPLITPPCSFPYHHTFITASQTSFLSLSCLCLPHSLVFLSPSPCSWSKIPFCWSLALLTPGCKTLLPAQIYRQTFSWGDPNTMSDCHRLACT